MASVQEFNWLFDSRLLIAFHEIRYEISPAQHQFIDIQAALLNDFFVILIPTPGDKLEIQAILSLEKILVEDTQHPTAPFSFIIVDVEKKKNFLMASPSYLDKNLIMEEIRDQISSLKKL